MRRFRYILHKLLDIMSITCALAIVLSVLLNENSFLSFQIWFNDFEIFTLICANYKLMLIKLSGKPTKCNCLITCSYMICSPFFFYLLMVEVGILFFHNTLSNCFRRPPSLVLSVFFAIFNLASSFGKGGERFPRSRRGFSVRFLWVFFFVFRRLPRPITPGKADWF